jgi:hypothetical protein
MVIVVAKWPSGESRGDDLGSSRESDGSEIAFPQAQHGWRDDDRERLVREQHATKAHRALALVSAVGGERPTTDAKPALHKMCRALLEQI